MSGQAGGRGYLIQALVSVLDALTEDHDWTAIQLEPNVASDKVDILWEYPSWRKVVQVKSSQNQIGAADVRAWASELEGSITADEYELRLIGPVAQSVPGMKQIGKVNVPTPSPLDLNGLIRQAAHLLDRYLQSRQLGIHNPSTREMAANALATRLSTYATTGAVVRREVFDSQLLVWVGSVAEVSILPTHAQHEVAEEYAPRPDDVEVLVRLANARQNLLLLVRVDSVVGFVVLIDGQPMADFHDPDGCLRYFEAVQRLADNGLLLNPLNDGQAFNLSSDGREFARQLERTCLTCEGSKRNIEPDAANPPIWKCMDPSCIDSWFFENAQCPRCGKGSIEIVREALSETTLLCEDGHEFIHQARRG